MGTPGARREIAAFLEIWSRTLKSVKCRAQHADITKRPKRVEPADLSQGNE